MIRSQEGQDLVGLVFAVAVFSHQALQKAAGHRAQFRKPLRQEGVLPAQVFTGQMIALDAALSGHGTRQ